MRLKKIIIIILVLKITPNLAQHKICSMTCKHNLHFEDSAYNLSFNHYDNFSKIVNPKIDLIHDSNLTSSIFMAISLQKEDSIVNNNCEEICDTMNTVSEFRTKSVSGGIIYNSIFIDSVENYVTFIKKKIDDEKGYLFAATGYYFLGANLLYSEQLSISNISGFIEFKKSYFIADFLINYSKSLGDDMIILNPNPSKNHVKITSKNNFEHIEIYDIGGKLIISKNVVETKEKVVSVEHLNSGVYFVKVNKSVAKLVKN